MNHRIHIRIVSLFSKIVRDTMVDFFRNISNDNSNSIVSNSEEFGNFLFL